PRLLGGGRGLRHLEERLADQLDLDVVGVLEVDRLLDTHVGPEVLDTGGGQPALCVLEHFWGHRDRDVLDPAEPLPYGLESEGGEVEEAEQVAVADVEEEVRRPRVVAVLEQLHEREADELLIEADRPLGIGADQSKVMDAAADRIRALTFGQEVAVTQGLAL